LNWDKSDIEINKETLDVDLQYPNLVKVDNKIVGVWSMVYDEGFEIFIGD